MFIFVKKPLGNKGNTSPVDELLVVANILNGFSSELPKVGFKKVIFI